jgi:hypothetical protein
MTSQITKDFQMKSKLRKYADGGNVRPALLGDGMAGRAGGLLSGRGRQIDDAVNGAVNPKPTQTSAPAKAPKPEKKGLRSFFGLADGGVSAEGGRVKGPGGRTEDKVGPVMLSDEEYVLPGDTADAIGRDKLDAIRLATHDFKSDSKESALRAKVKDEKPVGLADGGAWIADGKGNVRKPNAFGDAAAGRGYTQPRQLPPPAPGTAVGPSAMAPGRPPIDITPPGSRTAPAAQVVDAVTDVRAKTPMTRAMGAAKSALRGGAPIAGIAGALEAGALGGGDLASGYRDQFQKDMGVETPLGSVVADTARTLASVGDAATFGVAGRLGRGIASAVGGGSFMDGFTSDSARDQFEAARARDPLAGGGDKPPSPTDAAASALRSDQGAELPVQPGSYQSRRLSQMGVPEDVQNSAPIVDSALRGTQGILKTGGTSQFQNLGTYGGNANIYGRSSDPSRPGRINEFVGVGAGASPTNEASGSGSNAFASAVKDVQSSLRGGAGAGAQPAQAAGPSSSASEINARYDKLAKQLSGMYGPKGQGNLARRMLELEQSRTNALDADARNLSSLRGQDMTAETSRSNAELNARVQMADALGRMEQNRATISSQAQAAQLKALQEAQKTAREGEEKGFDRYTAAIAEMFTVTGEDGKQTVDKAAQEQFRAFIEGSDPEAGEKFARMGPQEQQALLQNFKVMFDMNQARNKTAQSGSWASNTGGVTNRMDMPTDIREATFNDWWNNNLPLKDYIWSNVPGTNRNVVVTESGQPTLYSDYTSTGGERDLDKEKIVRDSVRARQSALRSN